MTSQTEIRLIGITKKYHKKEVISNYSYTFSKGKCYMIVGENGTGKSTLLKIILGMVRINSGEIINPFKRISYVPEKSFLPMGVSVCNFINVLSNILECDIETINYLFDYFEIGFAKKYKLRELSKGMLQKVLVIQALMKDSDVYIFDEVLNGLDSKMQEKFLSYIEVLKKENALILITSHYSHFYKKVVDEVVEMKRNDN